MPDKLLIALDPGRVNFAYTVLSTSGKIVSTGLLNKLIRNLTDLELFNDRLKELKEELLSVEGYSSNNRLLFERFIPRSLNRGNTSELILMHIGIVLGVYDVKKIVPITAATWKSFYNRNDLWVKNDSLPPHILDSMFMGYWYLIKVKCLTIDEVKQCLKKIKHRNFNWYCYRGQWLNSERPVEHKRGRRNSFGN